MGFFTLTQEERASFLDVVRHTVLEGPLHLVRFSDSNAGIEGGWGRRVSKLSESKESGQLGAADLYASYWMYASEVRELVSASVNSRPYGITIVQKVSERWAHCADWGDLGRLWEMHIPDGGMLHAYFGLAKFQPKISVAAQERSGRYTTNSFPGEGLQFVVRIGPEEKRWISGPLRTLNLSPRKF